VVTVTGNSDFNLKVLALGTGFPLQVVLPLIIAALMFGIGMSLSIHSFAHLLLARQAATIAFFNQFMILPLLAFFLAWALPMPPELGVGLVILAACPSASTSNLYTYLARGDTALSISLTAFNKMFSVITIPFYVNLAVTSFTHTNKTVALTFSDTFARLALLVLLPTMTGMAIRHGFPAYAGKAQRYVKRAAVASLALLIAWLIIQERHSLVDMLFAAGPAAIALCILIMCCGYGISSLFSLPDAQRTAITLENGMQSGGMAIAIAAGILESPAMAIPAAVYSLAMYLLAGAFVFMKNYPLTTQLQPR